MKPYLLCDLPYKSGRVEGGFRKCLLLGIQPLISLNRRVSCELGGPVYYTSGTGETYETLDEEAMLLARLRLEQAEDLRLLFMNPDVSIPCIFRER